MTILKIIEAKPNKNFKLLPKISEKTQNSKFPVSFV